jgi:hypothetical protein
MIDIINELLQYIEERNLTINFNTFRNFREDYTKESNCISFNESSGSFVNSKLDIQDIGLQVMVQCETRVEAMNKSNEIMKLFLKTQGNLGTNKSFYISNITTTSMPILLEEYANGKCLYSTNYLITYQDNTSSVDRV